MADRSGPGLLGLWRFPALDRAARMPSKRPLYDIGVQPGNKTIRRKSDQAITAELFGFSARKVTLYAKYGSALKWEQAPMQPQAGWKRLQIFVCRLVRTG